MISRPALMTFDIFGTVLDWHTGLENACRSAGRALLKDEFDRIVDLQGELEQGPYLDYVSITCRSLVDAIGIGRTEAARIAADIATWPLYPDATLLRDLMEVSPCAAMTNSDRVHAETIQTRLGCRLHDWLCAEDVRLYKPDPRFWWHMRDRREVDFGPHWWHISAYADYDIAVAKNLGLTTVFVERPHARSGEASYTICGLDDLLAMFC